MIKLAHWRNILKTLGVTTSNSGLLCYFLEPKISFCFGTPTHGARNQNLFVRGRSLTRNIRLCCEVWQFETEYRLTRFYSGVKLARERKCEIYKKITLYSSVLYTKVKKRKTAEAMSSDIINRNRFKFRI